uniref:Uncharacterized protein LOC114344217 n=1 Tax=Diabrotica virgifera virgifera TaxID=50390 RepID=A0A6P7GLT4_DIAVI
MAGSRRAEMIGAREVKEWCGSEGEMGVEEFVERVEMLQQINGWTEQNTADLVRRRMIGEAAEFLRNATSEKQEGWTWKEIKGLLLQRFGVKKDRVDEMVKLMNIRRKEGENYRRFADRCRTAARYVVKEYEKEEEKKVANEIREEIILGVFMEGLNSEVRRVVKARKGVNTLTVVLDMLKDIGEEGDRKRVRKVRKELEEEEANSSDSEKSFATVASNSSERRGIRRIEGEKKEGFVKMNRADAIVAGGSKWHDRANPAGEVQGERQRSLRRVPYTPCRRCGQRFPKLGGPPGSPSLEMAQKTGGGYIGKATVTAGGVTSLIITADFQGANRKVLVDTGADVTLLREAVEGVPVITGRSETITGVTGVCQRIQGKQKLNVTIGDTAAIHEVWIVDVDCGAEGILGLDLMKRLGLVIDVNRNELRTKEAMIPVIRKVTHEILGDKRRKVTFDLHRNEIKEYHVETTMKKLGNSGSGVNRKETSARRTLVIAADSHGRFLKPLLQRWIGDEWEIEEMVWPGHGTVDIINGVQQRTSTLGTNDCLVLLTGTNDIRRKQQEQANDARARLFVKTEKPKIILCNLPKRFDVVSGSTVVEDIRQHNLDLLMVMQIHMNVDLVDIYSGTRRSDYTKQGFHFNLKGKIKLAERIREVLQPDKRCCEMQALTEYVMRDKYWEVIKGVMEQNVRQCTASKSKTNRERKKTIKRTADESGLSGGIEVKNRFKLFEAEEDNIPIISHQSEEHRENQKKHVAFVREYFKETRKNGRSKGDEFVCLQRIQIQGDHMDEGEYFKVIDGEIQRAPKDRRIRAICGGVCQKNWEPAEVVLKSRAHLPAWSETILKAKIRGPNQPEEIIVEQFGHLPSGVRVNRVMATRMGDNVWVKFINCNQEPVELSSGRVVGKTAIITRDNTKMVRQVRVESQGSDFTEEIHEKLARLSVGQEKNIGEILLEYRDVMDAETEGEFSCTNQVQHKIITGDAAPIAKPAYRVPFRLQDEMRRQIQDLLDKGIIAPSTSPWAAPVIVKKKALEGEEAKYRFCTDFRVQHLGGCCPDS